LNLWATGDVLDALPFAGHGHPANWPAALSLIAADAQTQILPGHGPIFVGAAQLERMRDYWGFILGRVRDARSEGKTLEELQGSLQEDESPLAGVRTQLVVDELSKRAFDAWFPEAVAKAWAELEEPGPGTR
jgi:glyoxylase-like metal-dependent hydrolase (beta-lactamase superfamily II)